MDMNRVRTVMNSVTGMNMTRMRIIGFMLLSIILLMPALAQADMVFDFQMKMAQKGNAEAQFKVGEMYESGFGVEKDLKEAKNWVSKAAGKGHETASYKLLYWDIEKNGLTNSNKINIGSLKAKAKQGNAQAAYYLGKMYSRGIGFKRNSSTAAKWLNKAALAGAAEAEAELVVVRERQQKQKRLAAQRRFEEKKRTELKAKQERERLARQEQNRKLKAQKQAQQLASEKKAQAETEEIARRNREIENRRREIALANEKLAREKAAEEKRLLELKKERERQAKVLARKKALIKKQREEAAAKQKASFESDPCSGKSARFLSTCR